MHESKAATPINPLWYNDAVWPCGFSLPLFQVMACRLFGAKPLPEMIVTYFRLNTWKQPSVKFKANALGNVVFKMAAILFLSHFVNPVMRCEWAITVSNNQMIVTATQRNGMRMRIQWKEKKTNTKKTKTMIPHYLKYSCYRSDLQMHHKIYIQPMYIETTDAR